MRVGEMMEEIALFRGYCCKVQNNREAMIMRKLVAVNYYYDQWMGLSLPLVHFRIQAIKEEN